MGKGALPVNPVLPRKSGACPKSQVAHLHRNPSASAGRLMSNLCKEVAEEFRRLSDTGEFQQIWREASAYVKPSPLELLGDRLCLRTPLCPKSKGAAQKVNYEIVESKRFPGEWIVEGINYVGDGEVYTTIFCGSDARGRAEAYATWLIASSAPLRHQLSQRTSVAESASAQCAKGHP